MKRILEKFIRPGSNGQILTTVAGKTAWAAAPGGGGGGGLPQLIVGSVAALGVQANSTTWVDAASVSLTVAATTDKFWLRAFLSSLINPAGGGDALVRLVVDGVAQPAFPVWYNFITSGAHRFTASPDFGIVTGMATGTRVVKVQISCSTSAATWKVEGPQSKLTALAVS